MSISSLISILALARKIAINVVRSDRVDRFAMLLLTSLGIACIYAGYKLFCGLPALNGETTRATRSGVLLLNIIPGILLALIGTGLLTAQAHGILRAAHPSSVTNRRKAHPGICTSAGSQIATAQPDPFASTRPVYPMQDETHISWRCRRSHRIATQTGIGRRRDSSRLRHVSGTP